MFFFFAFLLQTEHFGVSKHFALAALAVAVAGGSIVAMAIGSWLRSRAPQLIMFTVLAVAPVVAAVAAWFYGLASLITVAFAASCAPAWPSWLRIPSCSGRSATRSGPRPSRSPRP